MHRLFGRRRRRYEFNSFQVGDYLAVGVGIARETVEIPARLKVGPLLPVVPAGEHDEIRFCLQAVEQGGFEHPAIHAVLGDAGLPPRLAGAVELRVLHIGDLLAGFAAVGENHRRVLLLKPPLPGGAVAAVDAGAVHDHRKLRNLAEPGHRAEHRPIDAAGGAVDFGAHPLDFRRGHLPAVGLEIVERLAVDFVETGMAAVFFDEIGDPLDRHIDLLRGAPVPECDLVHKENREVLLGGNVERRLDDVGLFLLNEADAGIPFRVNHQRDRGESGGFHAPDLPAHDLGIRRVIQPDQRIAVAVPVQPPRFALGGQRRTHVRKGLLPVRVGEAPPDVPLLNIDRHIFQRPERLRIHLRSAEYGAGQRRTCGQSQCFPVHSHFLFAPSLFLPLVPER